MMQVKDLQWTLYPNDWDHHFVYTMPCIGALVLLLDFVIFSAIAIIFKHSLALVYPILIIVQHENAPVDKSATTNKSIEKQHLQQKHTGKHTVAPYLSSIYRVLVKTGGFTANFRGLSYAAIQFGLTRPLISLAYYKLGWKYTPLATLLAALLFVQLSTASTHMIITKSSNQSFTKRIPPFKRTIEATWRAVVLHWAATEIVRWLPTLAAAFMEIEWPEVNLFTPDNTYSFFLGLALDDGSLELKCVLIIVLWVIASIFLVLPTQVVLVKIQASLLPTDEGTIVPIDRSLGRKVDSIAGGSPGYATVLDAWTTFSWASWVALITLSLQVLISTLLVLILAVIIISREWNTLVVKTLEVNDF